MVTECLKDEVWSVRDAAASASGVLVRTFADSLQEQLPSVINLWFLHLCDNTFTVRFHTAGAIADCYDVILIASQIQELVAIYLEQNIMKVKQPAVS